MNKDQIGGVIRALLTAAAGWAVGKGFITNEQAADAIGLGVTLGVAAWSWYTNRPTVMIKTINEADNGVKVVADVGLAPKVNEPLK